MEGHASQVDLIDRTRLATSRHDAIPQTAEYVLPVIDWGGMSQYAPMSLDNEASLSCDPLPNADVVVVTWTIAEWAALHHVFCGYEKEMHLSDVSSSEWRKDWKLYSKDYYQIQQYMIDVKRSYQGGAPSLTKYAWCYYRMVKVNGLKVLLIKSEMHLAQDGTELPLKQLVHQVCDESSPQLVLSIGTAGGVRMADALGTALITNQAYFHLLKEFANASFNYTTVQSRWKPQTQHLEAAKGKLLQVAGFPIYPVSPQYPQGASIQPDAPDSEIKVVTDQPIITTDAFLFGTTENKLDEYGCIVEMDDAVVGQACSEEGVSFGFVRNVSDPVINGKLPLTLQNEWAGYIYKERGLFTSYNGALATWALIAGESDKV